MARDERTKIAWMDHRFGRTRDGYPFAMPENSCEEAYNVDFWKTTFGRKRGGHAVLSITGYTPTDHVQSLLRHVLGTTETAAEMWAFDGDGNPGRLSRGTNFSVPTLKDAVVPPSSGLSDIRGVSFNSKFYLTYNSGEERLHVWDGSTVRRVGLATPAAPTVADGGGGGTYATKRYYKLAYTVQSSGVTVRRSELSASVSFTPDGAHANATITKSAAIDEGETHWELYGSADDKIYFLIATTAIASTTVADTTAPASYTGNFPPAAGTNIVPKSWKFIACDQSRLVGAGSWTGNQKNNRVWWTPVLGTLDVGDDERVPSGTGFRNYIDIGENDGDAITAIAGPMEGAFFVFKSRQVWKLVPTGDDETPFQLICLSRYVGAIRQETVVQAEDETGNPAMYFLSHRGPYRAGSNGVEYMGWDIEDLWTAQDATIPPFGIYYADKHQVWWWTLPTGTNQDLTQRLVFDTKLGRSSNTGVRGGWTIQAVPAARSAVMFSGTVGTSMSVNLVPYAGIVTATGSKRIQKCDSGTTDDGAAYQAYIKTAPKTPAGLGANFSADDGYLHGQASTGTSIQVSLTRDFGLETLSGTVLLTAAASETRVQKRIEDSGIHDAGVLQAQIGDAAAVDSACWVLDALVLPVTYTEKR